MSIPKPERKFTFVQIRAPSRTYIKRYQDRDLGLSVGRLICLRGILRTRAEPAYSVLPHHGRSGQDAGGDFQVVQVFAAEILSEARVQAFA